MYASNGGAAERTRADDTLYEGVARSRHARPSSEGVRATDARILPLEQRKRAPVGAILPAADGRLDSLRCEDLELLRS